MASPVIDIRDTGRNSARTGDVRALSDNVVSSIVVDAQYEDTAIREAKRLDIPVIAIVDSNTNPKKVDYPIPANDDSMRTIQLIVSALADTIVEAKTKSSDKENNPVTSSQKDNVELKETKEIEESVEDTIEEEE